MFGTSFYMLQLNRIHSHSVTQDRYDENGFINGTLFPFEPGMGSIFIEGMFA